MDITQSSMGSSAMQNSPATAANPAPRNALSSDFETFLKMLTTQMQNQDPLNPIESSDFAVQLATFSGVEQQVKTNDLLSSLAQQMGVLGLSQLAGWVGMDARVSGPIQFNGTPITLVPAPESAGVPGTLVVRNEAGAEVQRLPIDMVSGPIVWGGAYPEGTPIASGNYTFEIESGPDQDSAVTRPVDAFARIVEARILDGTTMVVLAGGQEVAASQITALRPPAG